MGNAISACFSKYATFSGRATRSEFWFFYLFYMIVYVIGAVVGAMMDSQFVMYLFILPLIIPMLAAAVRRLHDVGRSGWFYLVPIYNIVLLCTASNPGSNKYGD